MIHTTMRESAMIRAFSEGRADRIYDYLGSHPTIKDGCRGWVFRTWAPHASAVWVSGSFNNWTPDEYPMEQIGGGIWALFVAGLEQYDTYQYVIQTYTGERLHKADPYAFHTETRPAVWSKLYDLSGFQWNDQPWMRLRGSKPAEECPLNIYELHLGSWRRDGEGRLLSYREITKWLVPYVKEMGFTHVELLPVAEHTRDERYGFLCSNFFAPTSRFGTPHDFMYLVDQLHRAGVGILLDWTPACFPQYDFGLSRFDGDPCYEYADPQKAVFPNLPANFFDFSRGQVRSFLTSCALFWMRMYHLDGLRMDSVSNMIYLDYGGKRWHPNANGGRENLEAVSLLRHLNKLIHGEFPGTVTIADETTTWPYVTHALKKDKHALGFTFKWNLGWMRDSLHYLRLHSIYRQSSHGDITRPMDYAFSESFILPISHYEEEYEKYSLIDIMPGEDGQKFAGVRVFYLYMLTCPGKKLTMMGTEFGQFRHWNWRYSMDWHLLEYQPFRMHQHFFREANEFYLEHPSLWAGDADPRSFRWICADDAAHNVITYIRTHGEDRLYVALNFSRENRIGYRMGIPKQGEYRVVFHTDATDQGGGGRIMRQLVSAAPIPCNGFDYSLHLDLPPLTGIVLRRVTY